jgi:hypothetical protein
MRGNILQAAVRSSVLSGAVLLTAGAIAVAPLQPLPRIQTIEHSVSTAAVNLTSNAFDLYGQVLQTSVANLQSDVKSYLDMGVFPVLQQILTNQVGTMTGLIDALGDNGRAAFTALTNDTPTYVETALGDLGQANVEGALNNLQLAILLPVFALINPLSTLPTALGDLVSQPLQSMINIAKDLPNILLDVGLGVIGPLAGGLGAVGAAAQNVINAVKAGNLGQLATAAIQAPATVVDGILNGGYGPNLGPLVGLDIPGFNILAGGLIGGGATLPNGYTIAGTLASLVSIVRAVVADVTPKTTAAAAAKAAATTATTKAVSDVASLPSASATAVTLSAAAITKAVSSNEDSTGEGTKTTRSDRKAHHDGSGTSGSDSGAAGSSSSDTDSSPTGTGSTHGHSGSKGTHSSHHGSKSHQGSKSHHHAA